MREGEGGEVGGDARHRTLPAFLLLLLKTDPFPSHTPPPLHSPLAPLFCCTALALLSLFEVWCFVPVVGGPKLCPSLPAKTSTPSSLQGFFLHLLIFVPTRPCCAYRILSYPILCCAVMFESPYPRDRSCFGCPPRPASLVPSSLLQPRSHPTSTLRHVPHCAWVCAVQCLPAPEACGVDVVGEGVCGLWGGGQGGKGKEGLDPVHTCVVHPPPPPFPPLPNTPLCELILEEMDDDL